MAVVCSVGCGCGSVSFQRCESLMLSNPTSSKPRTFKIFATTPPPSSKPAGGGSLHSLQPKQSSSKNKRKGIPYEKMDDWMRDSVAEIVKKLPESPLLIHVYSENATMETTAVEENWVSMKQKWKKGERAMPDGVIFVDQIQGVEEGTWGIVVQSKSEEEDNGCGSGPGTLKDFRIHNLLYELFLPRSSRIERWEAPAINILRAMLTQLGEQGSVKLLWCRGG
ncbi:hypothetical protein PVK06_046227 [Gossypium arboreum]|uniref:DUF7804 domain-containing protein n=1 Tax=Gossypium arboreum TaxID=29729 RepID=A0ABR0MAC8_GOSAR|nr:hypothetical protein PVK06_046227 [Gossypium arboreum]